MNNALTELLTNYEVAGYDFAVAELSNGGSLTILLHDVAFLHAGITATADGIKAIKVDSAQFSHDLMAAGNDPAATLERMQKSNDPSAFPALTEWEVYGCDKEGE